MKFAMFPNFLKKYALECSKDVCSILHEHDAEIYIDEKYYDDFKDLSFVKFGQFQYFVKDADAVVAVGGDGTILKCAEHILGLDIQLLGINTGRLGFMASLEYDELNELSRLFCGDYKIIKRMMIDTHISAQNTSIYKTALNDVSISGLYSKICDFNIFMDDILIGKYRADGLVLSTPTGSTAYSLSAGGPIIEPELECIEMTLICPHTLFARPMLFSPKRILKIMHESMNSSEVFVSVDGNEPFKLKSGDYIEIKKSAFSINLIDMKGNTFYDSLNKKLMRSIKDI